MTDTLRQLAEAIEPDVWLAATKGAPLDARRATGAAFKACAAFVDAADPQTILALLDTLAARDREVRAACDCACHDAPNHEQATPPASVLPELVHPYEPDCACGRSEGDAIHDLPSDYPFNPETGEDWPTPPASAEIVVKTDPITGATVEVWERPPASAERDAVVEAAKGYADALHARTSEHVVPSWHRLDAAVEALRAAEAR